EGPDPDGELRIAPAELDPHAGGVVVAVLGHRRHRERPEVHAAPVREARLRPSAHHVAEHLGDVGADPAALLRILVVHEEALVLAVVAALDALDEALQDRAVVFGHDDTSCPEAATSTRSSLPAGAVGSTSSPWNGSSPSRSSALRTTLKCCVYP